MQDYSFKIILLGNSGVGKTSIYFYYTKNIFQDKYAATVGVDFATDFKNVLGKNVRLNIWDTAGEEKYRSTIANYFKGSHSCFLVFDLTNVNSFKDLEIWYKLFIESSASNNKENIVVLGNKCDIDEKEVNDELINKFIEDKKLKYFETSAKEGININEAFQYMAEKLVKQHENNEQNNVINKNNNNQVIINENNNNNNSAPENRKNIKCC